MNGFISTGCCIMRNLLNIIMPCMCTSTVLGRSIYAVSACTIYNAQLYSIVHKPLYNCTLTSVPVLKTCSKDYYRKTSSFDQKLIRLGSCIGDDEDIKAHLFYRSINWDDLFHMRLEPPFKPMQSKGHPQSPTVFHSESTAEADTFSLSKHSTVDVPSVSIAENTFNV